MPTRGEKKETSHILVVDRFEGTTTVLLDDQGTQIDVPRATLPAACRVEGAVLVVGRKGDGTYQWAAARRDRVEERRRIAESQERLENLRARDRGGDVSL